MKRLILILALASLASMAVPRSAEARWFPGWYGGYYRPSVGYYSAPAYYNTPAYNGSYYGPSYYSYPSYYAPYRAAYPYRAGYVGAYPGYYYNGW